MPIWLKKNWSKIIPIVISVIILSVFIFTCTQTKSHNTHTEIYDKLERLDNRIERIDNFVENKDRTDVGFEAQLEKAKELRDKAEIEWSNGNYSEADILIKEAQGILPIISELNWWLYGLFLVIGLFLIMVLSMRPKSRRS